MIRSDEELEALKSRVAKAQSECDAALAARHRTQKALQSALDAINRATQEGNTSGDLSEARKFTHCSAGE